jgi:pantetheine-phosphate adenylyltransferase|tara:strand:+ start:2708 stop:3187 length:480 start_codon:yes stop_codon:yes gene_type:complete
MRRALYPGTFDPVTNGHLDILKRACRLFDEVVVAVAPNETKGPVFSTAERVGFIRENIGDLPARVVSFNGLLVDFAKEMEAIALIRGLRAVSDFEFEFQLTQMNRELDNKVETIFLMPSAPYFFTSSSLMKQVSRYDPERIKKYVPANVLKALSATSIK